ncbi:hypothetical protein MIND_00402200 [Mycena indigotica]|uniref:F-box domain-containing protein n=1 Tax=Mycena indigotica TaxID=2126181 RepID=A0A8H6T4L4_9AGAR|nr:uncharacterized protein MIND_00402200 [Mycena indigotica]KAF7310282.1 hypothetical protein MIND_00402200 [Mycena indigotica]
MAVALPPEITDSIIEQIYLSASPPSASFPTLRACSLVCRAWLPASRHHLPSKLSLSPLNFRLFVRHVETPENTLFAYLRELQVSSPLNPVHLRTLVDLLGRFSVLAVLKLTQSPIAFEFPPVQCLTSLELRHVRFDTFDRFTQMLRCLPNLRRLCVAQVVWASNSGEIFEALPLPVAEGPPIELELFEFDLWPADEGFGSQRYFLSWLKAESGWPRASKLVVRIQAGTDDLSNYLERLGAHLIELNVRDVNDRTLLVELRHNTALRRLRLCPAPTSYAWRSTHHYLMYTLPNFFSQSSLLSPHLAVLTLDLPDITPDDLRDLPQDAMDRLAALVATWSSPFPRLRRIEFNIRCRRHVEDEYGLAAGHHRPGSGEIGEDGLKMCEVERDFRTHVLDPLVTASGRFDIDMVIALADVPGSLA